MNPKNKETLFVLNFIANEIKEEQEARKKAKKEKRLYFSQKLFENKLTIYLDSIQLKSEKEGVYISKETLESILGELQARRAIKSFSFVSEINKSVSRRLEDEKVEKTVLMLGDKFNSVLKHFQKNAEITSYFDLEFDFDSGQVWRKGSNKYDKDFSRPFKIKKNGKLTKEAVFRGILNCEEEYFFDKTIFNKLDSHYEENSQWKSLFYDIKKQILSAKFRKISTHGKEANNWLIYGGERLGIKLKPDK